MAINAPIMAPALGLFSPSLEGQVILAPATTSRTTDLGTNSGGNLGLTDAELDRVQTNVLRIGSASPPTAGNIVVTAPITQAGSGYSILSLRTTGSILNGGGSIGGTNLAV